MVETVDIAVEKLDDNFYQFLNVSLETLKTAVCKGIADESVLSVVSLDSAALVIPWAAIKRILYVSVSAEAKDDLDWSTIWDRAAVSKKRQQRRKKTAYDR